MADDVKYGAIEASEVTRFDGQPATIPAHAHSFERVRTAGGPVVLCNPSRAHYRQWQSMAGRADGNVMQAYDLLFVATVVSHNQTEVAALLEKHPGIPNSEEPLGAMRRLSGQAVKAVGEA